MGKLDTNKKMKENSLLNTAFGLFTTKGINKTSISDIAADAGVAKGTFYLYFKDKYDIRNRLVCHKSSQLFMNAIEELVASGQKFDYESKIIFFIDNIINQLCENKSTLTFIAKNLSWGIFKNAITSPVSDTDMDFKYVFDAVMSDAPNTVKEPEIMLFMIIELVSSTCYSSILYSEPCEIEKLKPYIYSSVKHMLHDHITY